MKKIMEEELGPILDQKISTFNRKYSLIIQMLNYLIVVLMSWQLNLKNDINIILKEPLLDHLLVPLPKLSNESIHIIRHGELRHKHKNLTILSWNRRIARNLDTLIIPNSPAKHMFEQLSPPQDAPPHIRWITPQTCIKKNCSFWNIYLTALPREETIRMLYNRGGCANYRNRTAFKNRTTNLVKLKNVVQSGLYKFWNRIKNHTCWDWCPKL